MKCELISDDLTDEQKAQICGVVSVGCDWQTAANFTDCSLAGIRRAMRLDPRFAASVRRAEAGAELSHMRTIQKACEDPKNWRTSVWWLERRAPERFARRADVITTEQLKAFVAMLIDTLNSGQPTSSERSQLIARLHAFADSVERLMWDEGEAAADTVAPIHGSDSADGIGQGESSNDFSDEIPH
jgi:hypothetical protein